MTSFPKHFGRTLALSVILLAGCSEPAVNAPVQDTAQPQVRTQQQVEKKKPFEIGEAYKTRIASLKESPAVLAAFEMIEAERDANNKAMIELNEIPAPPFGEETRGQRVAQMFHDAGLGDVKIDAVGNVIGMRPGRSGAKTIAIGAHIDTVFPIETDVTVRREGDTYIAPGIGDNTRGVIVLLSLIKAMNANLIETDANIMFVGNVGEEGLGDLRGIKHLYRDGAPKIDSFIAVDGGSDDRLVYGGVGSHRYRVTFKGPGGHSWGDFGEANPHHALGRAITLYFRSVRWPSPAKVPEDKL